MCRLRSQTGDFPSQQNLSAHQVLFPQGEAIAQIFPFAIFVSSLKEAMNSSYRPELKSMTTDCQT